MSTVRFICFVAAALAALLLVQAETEKKLPPMCRPGLIVDCRRDFEELVWSTDETGTCKVLLNRCIYNSANCARYRQDRPLLKETSKEKCQKSCVKDCSQAPKQTLCTKRGDKHCQFDSTCEWEKYICNSGEFWFETASSDCATNPSICTA